jgi:phage N-6-adenine-methyltransferase
MLKDSGNVEWYTPKWIIDIVHNFYGKIDLDPASCSRANEVIQAESIFTKESNGLNSFWWGKVWVNHPYGKKENTLWTSKIIEEYIENKFVTDILGICYASTSEKWFQNILNNCDGVSFISPRVSFVSGDNQKSSSPQKGACIYYFGDNITGFHKHFSGKLHKEGKKVYKGISVQVIGDY